MKPSNDGSFQKGKADPKRDKVVSHRSANSAVQREAPMSPGLHAKGVRRVAEIEHYFRIALANGDMKEGDRLPSERELAKLYSASRGTVRLALGNLERNGLLARRLGSGTYVARSTTELSNLTVLKIPLVSPLDVMEARLVIEPGFVDLAVARATEESFQRMRSRLQEIGSAIDAVSFKKACYSFHLEVARATRNPLLIAMHEMIIASRAHAGWETFMPLNDTKTLRNDQLSNLTAIYDALRRRDGKLAADLYRNSHTKIVHVMITLPSDGK